MRCCRVVAQAKKMKKFAQAPGPAYLQSRKQNKAKQTKTDLGFHIKTSGMHLRTHRLCFDMRPDALFCFCSFAGWSSLQGLRFGVCACACVLRVRSFLVGVLRTVRLARAMQRFGCVDMFRKVNCLGQNIARVPTS